MTITHAQIADLRVGDIIDAVFDEYPEAIMRGPIRRIDDVGHVWLGPFTFSAGASWTVTVVERAPRPLFVNSSRTYGWEGDIVRDRDGDAWIFRDGGWVFAMLSSQKDVFDDDELRDYAPLVLLWDGEKQEQMPAGRVEMVTGEMVYP